MRGVAEPIGPRRTSAQIELCHRNEEQFDDTFGHVPGFEILCPYDVTLLDPAVIARARRTHALA